LTNFLFRGIVVTETFGGDIMSKAPLVKARKKLVLDKEVPPTTKTVYLTLCNFRNNESEIPNPTRRPIMRSAGTGDTTLTKSLRILVERGYIEITPNYIKDEFGQFTGERTSNSYKILDV